MYSYKPKSMGRLHYLFMVHTTCKCMCACMYFISKCLGIEQQIRVQENFLVKYLIINFVLLKPINQFNC